MTEKTPQDRKTKDAGYQFTVKGKTYTLPKPDESAMSAIPGAITYAAVMSPDDQMAQMRLAFATLDAAKPTQAAKDALLSLGTDEMLEHVGAWMGESSGSSD